MDTRTIRARDDGLRRLRRVTLGTTATAGALAIAFAGLAEKAFPGRSSHARTTRLVHAAPRVAADPKQTAPPLVSVGSQQQPQAQAQQAAPTPTSAPPVVVSGGS